MNINLNVFLLRKLSLSNFNLAKEIQEVKSKYSTLTVVIHQKWEEYTQLMVNIYKLYLMLKKMTKYTHNDTELFWLWGSFGNELSKLLPLIDKKKSNDYNRVYARSLFSMIEGISFRLRQILLQRHHENKISLSIEQIIALSEISIEIDDNGALRKNQKNYRFENLFRFTYKTYCESYKKSNILDKYISDYRYDLFKKAITIRNRVTHPKIGKDVFISGSEIMLFESVLKWFEDFIFDILEGDLLIKQKH